MRDGQRDHSKLRSRLLKRAQDLARSGAYPDVDSIAAALESDGEFALAQSWFADSRFRAQLQRLCARAHGRKGGDVPAT
jgi:hypothetical protein